jgi:hypothetical protein
MLAMRMMGSKTGEVVLLEVVEVELALGAQDIVTDGFEGVLQKAVQLVGGKIILNERAPDDTPYQRIAALSVPDGSLDQTVYVLLSRDGLTMTVSADTEEP